MKGEENTLRRTGYAKIIGEYIHTDDAKYNSEDDRKKLYYPTFSYIYKGNKYSG